jgi:mono/diheme cytochrome c family protein
VRAVTIVGAVLVVMILAVVFLAPRRKLPSSPWASAPPVPKVAGTAVPVALARGKALFERNCMECHGPGAKGSDKGPPLVHRLYEPNHHADVAFILAVQRGVKEHHWNFGDMASLPGVSRDQTSLIVVYLRDLQRKAGIF